MDWRGVTAAWVREGLITEPQREPLLRWLDEHAPPHRWLTDRVLPALVALSTWLLTGSAYLLASELLLVDVVLPAFAGLGALQIAIGGIAARRGFTGVAVGAVGAGVVVLALATTPGMTTAPRLALACGAALVVGATAIAMRLRSRGVALAAAVGGLFLALPWWLDTRPSPAESGAIAMISLGGAFAFSWLLRRFPQTLPADPAALFPTFLLLRLCWEATGGATVSGAAAAGALGLVWLGLAAVSESVGFVACGVVAFAFAESALLSTTRAPAVATAVLGGEGALLALGVVVFLAWRAGIARHRDPQR